MSLTDTELSPADFIAAAATTPEAVDLTRLALLGVLETPEGRIALIRKPDGGFGRFIEGDWIGTFRLETLTASRAILSRAGEAVALYLPGLEIADGLATSLRPQARPQAA